MTENNLSEYEFGCCWPVKNIFKLESLYTYKARRVKTVTEVAVNIVDRLHGVLF